MDLATETFYVTCYLEMHYIFSDYLAAAPLFLANYFCCAAKLYPCQCYGWYRNISALIELVLENRNDLNVHSCCTLLFFPAFSVCLTKRFWVHSYFIIMFFVMQIADRGEPKNHYILKNFIYKIRPNR